MPVVHALLAAHSPHFADRTRGDLARQGFMRSLGARLGHLSPGRCELTLDMDDGLTQQHGFFHGGVIASLADVSGGYAAFTLLPEERTNVTSELTVRFLAPALGVRLVAEAVVLKPGRTLTVCRCDVHAEREDGQRTLSATALATYVTTSRASTD